MRERKAWKRDGLKNMHYPGPSEYRDLYPEPEYTEEHATSTHTDGSGPTVMFTLNVTDDQLLEKLTKVREQWFKIVMGRKRRRQRATAWAILLLLILGTTAIGLWVINYYTVTPGVTP